MFTKMCVVVCGKTVEIYGVDQIHHLEFFVIWDLIFLF